MGIYKYYEKSSSLQDVYVHLVCDSPSSQRGLPQAVFPSPMVLVWFGFFGLFLSLFASVRVCVNLESVFSDKINI